MSENNDILHEFTNLSLWEHFKNTSGASAIDIAMVESHIMYAMPLLDRYTQTFKKYTLHNNWHQKNIIRIIGDLLGPNVKMLTSLECAMLLLSAVYHDLGMVFTDDELASIGREPKFRIFLQENAKAMLDFEENDRQPNSSLIEWYCRWMHAERVWVYINKKNAEIPFKWENASIKDSLGHLCESHNFSVNKIIQNLSLFNNEYLGNCDLVFCAILLRLADILDFDNTRSPQSVYEFLNLDNPKNKLDVSSKIEWQKHLSSNGFKFNWNPNEDSVKAVFSATTPHPNIEVAIRTFIRSINAELVACNKLQQFCSSRWKEHPLPKEVDIQNLTAENYQSGDYHFSLSEDKILNLLTGEGLYNDDFIFIRELLQNAIDTSRHREFHEKQTNQSFIVSPIKVSFFNDKFGYQWIRIDDFGMGMNEDIISNHLLKKGESYYNSDKFKLEKIKINKVLAKDFVPISRFGIGLLSCFMAGDRIEISTKHISSVTDSHRLGIEGRSAHYILQSQNKHHHPILMPSEYNDDEGYRNEYGTSIAVRITTNKEFLGFDLKEELEKFVICSPIPILYKDVLIGGNFTELIYEPWANDEIISIETAFVNKVEETFSIRFKKGIDINIENINITQKSLNTNLKGQLIFVAVDADYENLGSLVNIGFKLAFDNDTFTLKVYSIKKEATGKEIELYETLDISFLLTKFKPDAFIEGPFDGERFMVREKLLLSHNGIVINDLGGKFALNRDWLNNKYSQNGHSNYSFIYSGILYFQDELLPDLSVSRNEIKGLPFELISNLSFALEPINKYLDEHFRKFNFFKSHSRFNEFTSLEIDKSGFYVNNSKFLDNFITLDIEGNEYSIEKLKDGTFENKQFRYNYYSRTFYGTLVDFVIEQNFEIKITFDQDNYIEKFLISTRKSLFPKTLLGFHPITFVKFDNDDKRLVVGNRINIDHPFTHWYMIAASTLESEYFYYSKQLIYTLLNTYKDVALENCGKILKRLNTILPEDLKPSKFFLLTESDLG